MSISRIAGQMLQAILARDGNNLAISNTANSTPLLYLDVTNSRVGINNGSPTSELNVTGTITVGNITIPNIGNVSVGNVNINNLTDPVQAQDAATKLYVDTTADNLIGNLVISNTTITTNQTNGDIILTATGTGIVEISGTAGIEIPVGNTAQRPSPAGSGTLRFNSTTGAIEIFTGSVWQDAGGTTSAITNQTITPDGSSTTYTLDQVATAAGILVTINGINQTPGVDYTVVNDQITFTTTPLSTDIVQVRFISITTVVTEVTNSSGTTSVSATDTPTIDFIINSNTVAQITSATVFNIANTHSLQLPVYTVAQATSLSNVATGQTIYVSNGDGGNPCLAVYSGGAWKRVSFGATIST